MISANDPTVKGGASNPWTVKKAFRACADRRGEQPPDDLARRVRGRGPADAEGDLHPRRQAVPRPHAGLGPQAADDRAGLRQLDRRWGLRPRHERLHRLRPRRRQGVPRRPAAGEDGDRRGVRRRVARRRGDARPGLRARRLPRRGRARRDPDRAADRGPPEPPGSRRDPPGTRGSCEPHRPKLAGAVDSPRATGGKQREPAIPLRRARRRPRRPPRPDPGRPQGAVRPARGDRADRRRHERAQRPAVRRVQAALRHLARHRLGRDPRPPDRHPGQRAGRAVLGGGAEGDAVHPARQPVGHAAALPAQHHRLHGRQGLRAGRDHQARRPDDQRRLQQHRPAPVGDHGRVLRCRQLRHERPRLRPALPLHLAEREVRRDGPRPARRRARDRRPAVAPSPRARPSTRRGSRGSRTTSRPRSRSSPCPTSCPGCSTTTASSTRATPAPCSPSASASSRTLRSRAPTTSASSGCDDTP